MQIKINLDLRCMDCGNQLPFDVEEAEYININGVYRIDVAPCAYCFPGSENDYPGAEADAKKDPGAWTDCHCRRRLKNVPINNVNSG